MPNFDQLLRRVGRSSVLTLGSAYVGIVLVMSTLTFFAPRIAGMIGFVPLAALIMLFIVVTWYREDDYLAAGVLFALLTGIAVLGSEVLAEVYTSGSIGGALLMVPGFAFALVVRAIVTGLIVAGVVWIARKIRPPRLERIKRQSGAGAV